MKRAFELKQKAFFIIFKGLSIAKNCLRPESVPLIESGRYLIKMTIIYKKQDFVLTTLRLYMFLTLTVSVAGVIQKVSLLQISNF